MSEGQRRKQSAPVGRFVSDEMLATFISLGRQLALQMAHESFDCIINVPGWSSVDLDALTDKTLQQMKTAARNGLVSSGANPDNEQWLKVWSAMESSYLETTAKLLAGAGLRRSATVQ